MKRVWLVRVFVLLLSASAVLGGSGYVFAADSTEDLKKRIENLEKETAELKQRFSILSRFPMPEEVTFCGVKVPVDRWYVREELDRQLLDLAYHRRQVVTWLKRSQKFFPFVENKLREFGLPDCIKYLMMVESSLLESSTSSAGAAGLWQFIPETGRRYNLSYNKFIDDRRDFERSTRAALSYLRDLHLEFQDWPLAMAAYNAGENKVRGEIQRQGFSEYWRLLFLNRAGNPTETNSYVYKILALNLVLGNPERYGFFIHPDDYFFIPETKEVIIRTKKYISLIEIARQNNTSLLELKKLNPWIRGEVLPRGEWTLLIPAP